MTQRLKSTLKASAAILFAFALLFTSAVPAFADDDPVRSEGTPGSDAQAAITKVLAMPKGTEIPAADVYFKYEKYGIGSAGTGVSNMPDLIGFTENPTIDTVSYTNQLKIAFAGTETDGVTTDDVTVFKKESGNIIPAAGSGGFDAVGEYIYRITETVVDYTYDATAETIDTHKSEAVYDIHVYVEREDPADDTSDLYVRYVVAWRTTGDDGDNDPAEEQKVDPTPGGGPDDEDNFSDMEFANTFVKTNSPDNPDPEDYELLFVSKAVTDAANSSVYFPFSVKVTAHDFVTNPNPIYKAYLMEFDTDEDKYVVVSGNTSVGNPSGSDDYGDYYEFLGDGTPTSINLKDGQRLVFPGTPVGTEWVAVEKLTDNSSFADYTASVDVTVNGVTISPSLVGEEGKDLTTFERLVGEDQNSAAFTNNKDPVLPMGISVSNLPYIGLILLALVSLAAYVALKARQRRRAAAEAVYFD